MKCYVINLERHKMRLKNFQAAVPNEFEVIKVSAIDKLKIQAVENKALLFDTKSFSQVVPFEPTWGEIACTLSHAKVWSMIAEDESLEDNDFALVAEDDLVFVDNARGFIEGIVDSLKENWPSIKLVRLHVLSNPLGALEIDADTVKLFGPNEFPIDDCGSALYMLRKSKAKELATYMAKAKPSWLADWFGAFTKTDEVLTCNVNLGKIDGSAGSDIEEERAQARNMSCAIVDTE